MARNPRTSRSSAWRPILPVIALIVIVVGGLLAVVARTLAPPTDAAGQSTRVVASVAAIPTPNPTLVPTMTPWPTPTPSPPPPTPAPTGTWTFDMYDARAVRWQDPDVTACTATAAQIMLNMAVYWRDYTSLAASVPSPAQPVKWTADISYARQEAVLAFERKNTTQVLTDGGADAHGWRNALNYYGWGSLRAGVFKDETFTTFDAAAKATVRAVALYRKPVGILAWAGQHAQVVSDYKVQGEDPRTGSTNFTILGVYITDPLRSDGYRNLYVPLASWRSGISHIRFVTYQMTNSPYVDPLDGHQGNAEWDGRWVIVAPIA